MGMPLESSEPGAAPTCDELHSTSGSGPNRVGRAGHDGRPPGEEVKGDMILSNTSDYGSADQGGVIARPRQHDAKLPHGPPPISQMSYLPDLPGALRSDSADP